MTPDSMPLAQVEEIEMLLYDMNEAFISIKNIAPQTYQDTMVKDGIAWHIVLKALGEMGVTLTDDALGVISKAGLLRSERTMRGKP